jgi:dipeptide/tripeptide permease
VDHENAEGEMVTRKRKETPEMTTGWANIWRKWPKTTFCIVVNENCERFSFYGMKSEFLAEIC